MVTMREVNLYRTRQLCNNYVLELWILIRRTGKITLSISQKEATAYIAHIMIKAGFSDESIMSAIDIKPKAIKSVKENGFKPTKGFQNAIKIIGNPLALLKVSDNYAYDYCIYPDMVNALLTEDMARAGWNALKISRTVGVNKRTAQRVIKRLKEEKND